MTVESGKPRRVVITGLGVISPVGSSPTELWPALVRGQSGISELAMLPAAAYPFTFGGAVPSFTGQIEDFGPLEGDLKKFVRKGLKVMCREVQMGVAAAQRSLHHAAFPLGKHEPDRVGVSFGTGYMMTLPDDFTKGIGACREESGDFAFDRWGTAGLREVTPLWLLKYLPNMPACHVAIYNDFRGPNNSITHSEAAANLAIGEAWQVIARGGADVMIAGATGTRLHPMRTIHTSIQEQLAPTNGLPPQEVSRPFDLNRTGMVVGEGAATIVMETLESAKARGATIYGEVTGFGSSCVITKRHVARRDTALANAMRSAMRQAKLTPDDIGHVNAHGLSTTSGDTAEAAAIHEVFGAREKKVPVVAAKGHFGNLGAGGGAVELVASVLALQAGHLFPVLNFKTPDPECPINAVTSADVPAGDSFVNVSVTNHGQASCILVQKYRE